MCVYVTFVQQGCIKLLKTKTITISNKCSSFQSIIIFNIDNNNINNNYNNNTFLLRSKSAY